MDVPFTDQVRYYLQAEALRRAYPGWSFAVQNWASLQLAIEAVNHDGGGLYCLISADPREIWTELRAL